MLYKKRKRIVIWLPVPGWWKIAASVGLAFVIIFAYGKSVSHTDTWSVWSLPLSGKVIVIDPGHGGKDGGAVSKDGLIEKHVTLSISLYLRDYLQQAGALVIMTREDDRELADPNLKSGRKRQDLTNRARIVKNSNADMLISIHLNSMHSSKWFGAQTFYDPNGHEENKTLAAWIQQEIIHNMENTERLAKTIDSIFLLKSVDIPAVLVEAGFLSNPREAELLGDERYQKKMAAAIYQGILRYSSGENFNIQL